MAEILYDGRSFVSQNLVFLYPEFLVILKVVVSHRPDFCSPTNVCLSCLYFLLLKLGIFTKSIGLNASQISWFPSASFFKCSLDGVAWRLSHACSMALSHMLLMWGKWEGTIWPSGLKEKDLEQGSG